jgi:hypothetical protein
VKRSLHILVLGAAIAVGFLLWSRVTPALTLPPTVAQWSIEGSQICAKPASVNFPLWPGTSGARLVCRAEYAGSLGITLTAYVMPDVPRATAFCPFQDWLTVPKQPGEAAFHYRQYLGVVESPSADGNTLDRFAAAPEASLQH